MNKYISSRANEIVKSDLKLLQSKYRKKMSQYIIYGQQLVDEAISSGIVNRVYAVDEAIVANYDVEKIITTKMIIGELTENANVNIVAICTYKENEVRYDERSIILDGVQDPGNLGTIIRTAYSFGFKQIILSNDCADMYSLKVLRSSHGANLHMNIIRMDIEDFLDKTDNVLVTTYLDEENTVNDGLKLEKLNIMFGNEGNGIREKFKFYSRENYRLNIDFESLNVAIAAGIIMYELR